MKKSLKRILIGLLCAAVCLCISFAAYEGIKHVRVEDYLLQYPMAVELSKSQKKEILQTEYSSREWEVWLNAERNGYFWHKGDLYYTFANAPGFLVLAQWDVRTNSMYEKVLVAENIQLPNPKTDTAKQVMGYTEELFLTPFREVEPLMQNRLHPLELNAEGQQQLQHLAFEKDREAFPADEKSISVPAEEWMYSSKGDLKVLKLHWEFQEEPYLWRDEGALIQNKNGEVYYAQYPNFSAGTGWQAYDIQPIPEPAQSALQNAFREIDF